MKTTVFEGDINQCYGCRACEQICPQTAIVMVNNDEGFLYPRLDSKICIECHLCEKVCPVINDFHRSVYNDIKVYAGWILNKRIQNESSSGGIFTAISQYVIKKSGVVFGAVWDVKLQVKHTYAQTLDELKLMRGSKYIQSNINDSYIKVKEFLKQGRIVLFTGTPCQIAGLLGYLMKDYDNLITCELICHGVPSQLAFDKYRQLVPELNNPNITNFVFRDMKVWSYTTKYYLNNNEKLIFGQKDFFMKSFLRSYTFRESCYQCKFASVPRIADITIADFWGIGEKEPFNHTNARGVSLVLVNTIKGNDTILKIRPYTFLEERTLEEAKRKNCHIYKPSERPIQRDSFYKDLDLPLDQLIDKYNLKPTFRNLIGFILRRFKNLCIK